MYEGVKSEVLGVTKFDENSDLTMTYSGRIDMMTAIQIKEKKSLIYKNKDI